MGLAGGAKTTARCGGDGFVQRRLIETPHRVECPPVDFEYRGAIPSMGGADTRGDRRSGREIAQVVLQQVESLVEREAPLCEDLLFACGERRGEDLGVAPRRELSDAAFEADP